MLTEVKQCFSVPIIVGSINVDNKALLELITKHRDNRVLMDHSDPNYEDTYLPPHRLIDSVIREVPKKKLFNFPDPPQMPAVKIPDVPKFPRPKLPSFKFPKITFGGFGGM